jgi:tetratricopeptide (TPR) repeat protein
VHRDLKPENVFLRAPDGARITLIDFGLARTLATPVSTASLELTRTGQQLGSSHYMAPEQLADPRRVDERADIYSLGAVLYECLAGRPPFVGDDAAVRHAHAARRPMAPSHRASAAAPLDAVVLRCLAKDPAQRFPSAAALTTAIAMALARATSRATPITPSAEPHDSASLRTVGLIGVRSSLPVTELLAAAEAEGGHLARTREDGYLFVFPQPSAEAALQAALRAGNALLPRLAPSDLLVLHAAQLSVRDDARGVAAVGPALDAPASWWPADDRCAGVLTTPAAAVFLESRAVRDGSSGLFSAEAPPAAPPAPMVGRDDLVAALLAEAERAFSTDAPVMSTVVGEVGYGKTRLLDALAERLSERAHVVVVRFRSPDAPDMESPAAVLGRAAGAVESATLPLEGSRDVVAKAIGTALRPAAGQPMALLVDDLQWADPCALDALERAAMDGGAPIWIAAAAAPDLRFRRPLWGERVVAHFWHRLEVLPSEAECALLRVLLQPVEFVPADVIGALQKMARGVPLFAVEVAHALRSGGAIRRSAGVGGWYLAADELLHVSSTPLAARLADRLLCQLAPGLRAFAELCAVLGDGFSRGDAVSAERAVALADAAADPLDPQVALERLARAGVLHQDGEARYRFRHPLLCAAIEQAMPAARCRRLHRIVLQDLSGREVSRAVVARHAERCGAHEEAFTNHLSLAEEARAVHQYLVAEEHYTAALVHLRDSDTRRGAVLAGRAKVRYRVQRFSDALDDLHDSRPYAEVAGDNAALADLLLEEATIHDWRESWEASADLVTRAEPLVERCSDRRLRARWLMALGRTRFRQGRLEDAVEHLSAGGTLAQKVADHETGAIASMLLGTALVSLGRLDEAEARFAAVIESCERKQDTLHLCSAYNNRIWLWFKRESLERAIEDQRRATALAREIAHVQLERSCTYNLAELLYWRGDLTEALALANRARDLQTRFLDDVPLDALLVARVSAALGDLAVAGRELEWVLARCPEDRRPPLVRTQVRLLQLVVEGGTSESWRTLVEDARRTTVLYELHEVVHFAAAAAVREGRHADASLYLEEGARLAGPSGGWRDRFARLRDGARAGGGDDPNRPSPTSGLPP